MTKEKIKKIFIIIFACFVAFTTIFYFLVGEQLQYKTSDKGVKMQVADAVSNELTEGIVYEQRFINRLDEIDTLAIVGNVYQKESAGILTIELFDEDRALVHQEINIADVRDQHRIFLNINEPIYGLKDQTLKIRIYSDSKQGEGIALMSVTNTENGILTINGETVNGNICFESTGKSAITFGSYYWPIMSTICLLLGLILIYSYICFIKGKNNYLVVFVLAVDKYLFLISQLVIRDFKTKYKRSIFGVFWSFLNPLLTMTVQFLVFSTIFTADTKNYPVYLLCGVVCFSFFSECTSMCLTSISGNDRLLTKVYIPKYIFPLSRTISSMVNLLISLVPLFLVCLIMRIDLHPQALLIFFFLGCLVLFSLGVGMFLSALMVFFRDIQFLWTVLIQIWMYATPIFYPAEIIPDKYKFIVQINPLYHFVGNARKCILEGISPEPRAYLYCLLFAAVSLLIGSFVFKKTQDKFALYL